MQYPERVKEIIVFDKSPGLFQTGEDIRRIWGNYQIVQGNFHKQSIAVFQHYKTPCPSVGCGRCDFPDCFYSEFIRNYWNCPKSD
jgi:hypothetical protein